MKGVYALIIELDRNERIQTGKLGLIEFKSGFYAYVGSALNSIEGRIGRHIRNEKKLRWHIDYLLKKARVLSVIYAESIDKYECIIAKELSKRFPTIYGFGSTDCRCKSHLFFSENRTTLENAVSSTINRNELVALKESVPNNNDGFLNLD
ncbi:MAG TPA: GIY-YIG nuclease family protein [Candidatus Altiarchaeales archaeon]|nr:GIY-YIG nuclease family protein [Candidatus Altiarchaeales archaeon]